MMFAVALWFGSPVNAANPVSAEVADGCGDAGCELSMTDINIVDAISNTTDGGNIVVTVTTCALFDTIIPEKRMVKYRLHIDHRTLGGERYGDSHVFDPDDDEFADCETTSDDGVMFRVHKNGKKRVYGPGTVQEFATSPYMLKFTIPYSGLTNSLDEDAVQATNTVHLWMDVQYEGICDRAPDTYEGPVEGNPDDACSKPELTTEVLTIQLQ